MSLVRDIALLFLPLLLKVAIFATVTGCLGYLVASSFYQRRQCVAALATTTAIVLLVGSVYYDPSDTFPIAGSSMFIAGILFVITEQFLIKRMEKKGGQ